jgi:hypothetical protein
MLPVRITVTVGGRRVSIDGLADARLASALRSAGQEVARRLAAIQCPVHHKTASDLRVHFDAQGSANLQYESCCPKLGHRIATELGSA